MSESGDTEEIVLPAVPPVSQVDGECAACHRKLADVLVWARAVKNWSRSTVEGDFLIGDALAVLKGISDGATATVLDIERFLGIEPQPEPQPPAPETP